MVGTPLNPQPPVPLPTKYPGAYENDDAPPPAFKRAGKSKPELIKKYTQRLETSKKWRADEGYEKTWKRLIDLYRNKQFQTKSTEDRIAVNIAFSTVNTIVPSISVNYPQITINARREEDQPKAQAAEAAINYWWRHYNWRPEFKRAVKDALIVGHGWVKVGWHMQHKPRPMTQDEHANEYDRLTAQASDAAAENPHLAAEIPTDEEIRSGISGETYDVIKDCPFVERVSPFDIFVDPESTCVEDLKWIAQKLVVPIEDVRKDERYDRQARKRLKPDASTNVRWRDQNTQNDASKTEGEYSDDVKRCTLWEFYDLRAGFYCVFTDSGDDFLLEPTDFPYPYGMPFRYLGNYEVPDQFYCLGDLEALEPLQHELNGVRSDMVNHRKRWQRAYLYKRDAVDAAGQNALLSDKDNRLIPIDGDQDLQNVVVPLAQIALDPQMYQHSQQIENDIDLVSGVSEYARGAQSEIRRTATEAAMIQDASNARSADKLAQIEQFISEVARCVLQLAQQFLTGDHMARIVGIDGAQKWVPFNQEQIQGEFDFEVEAGSTQPRDETFRRQNALQLVNVLAPYVGAAVNPQALVSYVLREGFGMKNVQEFILPPSDPGPNKKLIETMAYKDTPPDIQRQIEAEAGFQPSAIGPNMPPQNPDAAQEGQMADMGGQGGGGEPGTAPTDMPQQGAALPTSGMNIPPELLEQLKGQVGLQVEE